MMAKANKMQLFCSLINFLRIVVSPAFTHNIAGFENFFLSLSLYARFILDN